MAKWTIQKIAKIKQYSDIAQIFKFKTVGISFKKSGKTQIKSRHFRRGRLRGNLRELRGMKKIIRNAS